MNAFKRLQYSPSDIFIILLGFLCIVVGTHYFNSSGGIDSADFRAVERFGMIVKGKGTRKMGSSLQWFDVRKRSDLFFGDVIFANEKKDIEILLSDKDSRLIIPEDSMIKISRVGDEFNLDVSKGSVQIKTRRKRRINLRVRRGKSRRLEISKNSNVRISTKKVSVVIEAIEGKASIIQTNKKMTEVKIEVKKGKMLVVGRKKIKVLNKLQLLKREAVDPLYSKTIGLLDKFQKVKNLELSSRSDFKVSKTIIIKNGEIEVSEMAYGEYYIREPKKLDYSSFEIKELKKHELTILEKEKYFQGDILQIRWSGRNDLEYRVKVEGAKTTEKSITGTSFSYNIHDSDDLIFTVENVKYKRSSQKSISLSVSKDLNILEFKKEEENYRLTLENVKGIKFRVQVSDSKGKRTSNFITDKESIEIVGKKPELYTLKLLNIKTGAEYFSQNFLIKSQIVSLLKRKVHYSLTDKLHANLHWKRTGNYPKEMEYTLKVFESENATSPFLEETLSQEKFKFEARDAGIFWWKVESNQPELVRPSDMFRVELSRPALSLPVSSKIILKYKEENDCYMFTVPKQKYAKKYDMYIYSSRTKHKGKWKKMYHKLLNENSGCIKSKGEGKYYYKFRFFDSWGRKSSFTTLGIIYFPISPLDDF